MPLKLTERFRTMAEVPQQVKIMSTLSVIAIVIGLIALAVAIGSVRNAH